MSRPVTVYKMTHGFRVVIGEHIRDANESQCTVYPSAAVAYAAESTPAIRAQILRIDPNADMHTDESSAVRATLEGFINRNVFDHVGFLSEMERRNGGKLTEDEYRNLATLVSAYEKERAQLQRTTILPGKTPRHLRSKAVRS